MSFNFDFNIDHTRSILKGNKEADEWHQALVKILPKWKITTPNRVAAFLAQCAHESTNFTRLEENLNYSWQGLRKIFPRYFPSDSLAQQYHRQPEKIANRVYDDANRSSKLGNVAPGDGWRYRGRGIIQLTGKSNYLAFAADMGMSLDKVVEYVQTKEGAMESAAWFWNKRNINAPADQGDIEQVSELVNGGTIGLQDRLDKYDKALRILNEGTAAPAVTSADLKRGSNGPAVIKLQQALGIAADGVFGPGTEASLRAWQEKNKLPATGIATPDIMKRLIK